MKKFTVLLFVILVSLKISAQDSNANEKFVAEANKLVAEMNQVVTLSESEQKQIFDLDVAKRIKMAEIRKENAGNQPVIKEKVTELNKAGSADIRKVLGADRMKIWSEYRKEQQAKKQ